jgi:hypothetical protein
MLDVIEAFPVYRLHILETQTYNRYQFLADALKSPLAKDSEIAVVLKSYIQYFEADARTVLNVKMSSTDDEGVLVTPNGCKEKVQVATQVSNPMPIYGRRYIISGDVWDQMSEMDRAALILHESLLRYFMGSPDWNKSMIPIRFLTALLLSNEGQRADAPAMFGSLDMMIRDLALTPAKEN